MDLHQVVAKKLKERQDAVIEVMVNGVNTFDEYRHLVGQIHGMTHFMADIEKYLKDPDQGEGR